MRQQIVLHLFIVLHNISLKDTLKLPLQNLFNVVILLKAVFKVKNNYVQKKSGFLKYKRKLKNL